MARQQLILQSGVDAREGRLEAIEGRLGDPDRFISPDQAMQLGQAVKIMATPLLPARIHKIRKNGYYNDRNLS